MTAIATMKASWAGQLEKLGISLTCTQCGQLIGPKRRCVKAGNGTASQLLHYTCYKQLMNQKAHSLNDKKSTAALTFFQLNVISFNRLIRNKQSSCVLCQHDFKLAEVIVRKRNKSGHVFHFHLDCLSYIQAQLHKMEVK